jgi:hypothetical protein
MPLGVVVLTYSSRGYADAIAGGRRAEYAWLAALEQVLLAHRQPITPGATRSAAMTAFA